MNVPIQPIPIADESLEKWRKDAWSAIASSDKMVMSHHAYHVITLIDELRAERAAKIAITSQTVNPA